MASAETQAHFTQYSVCFDPEQLLCALIPLPTTCFMF